MKKRISERLLNGGDNSAIAVLGTEFWLENGTA